jgi:hypothetical protein
VPPVRSRCRLRFWSACGASAWRTPRSAISFAWSSACRSTRSTSALAPADDGGRALSYRELGWCYGLGLLARLLIGSAGSAGVVLMLALPENTGVILLIAFLAGLSSRNEINNSFEGRLAILACANRSVLDLLMHYSSPLRQWPELVIIKLESRHSGGLAILGAPPPVGLPG